MTTSVEKEEYGAGFIRVIGYLSDSDGKEYKQKVELNLPELAVIEVALEQLKHKVLEERHKIDRNNPHSSKDPEENINWVLFFGDEVLDKIEETQREIFDYEFSKRDILTIYRLSHDKHLPELSKEDFDRVIQKYGPAGQASR